MANKEFLHSTLNEEDSEENARQNETSEWTVYLNAAVKRRNLLASLNERLAERLAFFDDVGDESRGTSFRDASRVRPDSSPFDEASTRVRSNAQTERNHAEHPVEADVLEAVVESEAQNLRNSLKRFDIRIDGVRRGMNSLNQKNRELTEENAELRHSCEEMKCELQRLEYAHEKLEEKLQKSKRSAIARSVEQLSNQKLINSLRNENRVMRSRLEQQNRMLRIGLNGFISKSMEALKSGTTFQYCRENTLANVRIHEVGIADCRVGLQDTPSPSGNTVPREQLDQVEEQLRSVSDELERERFYSQGRTKRLQERINQLTENLRQRSGELQRTNDELVAGLGALQSLIRIGYEMQTDIDVYRLLLDRPKGSPLKHSGGFNSADLGYESAEFESRRPDTLATDKSEKNDCAASNNSALEIAGHDTRRGRYVVLRNESDEKLDITGWYLVQHCGAKKVCHRFREPFIIEPRNQVVLWSADVKITHRSPVNHVLHETVLPWLDSDEADLVTIVYDNHARKVTTRTTRIRLRIPLAAEKFTENPSHLLDPSCCIS